MKKLFLVTSGRSHVQNFAVQPAAHVQKTRIRNALMRRSSWRQRREQDEREEHDLDTASVYAGSVWETAAMQKGRSHVRRHQQMWDGMARGGGGVLAAATVCVCLCVSVAPCRGFSLPTALPLVARRACSRQSPGDLFIPPPQPAPSQSLALAFSLARELETVLALCVIFTTDNILYYH